MITVRGNFSGGGTASSCVLVEVQAIGGSGEYRYNDCENTDSGWQSLPSGSSVIECIQVGSLETTGSLVASIIGQC
jgi:hypothetical protein